LLICETRNGEASDGIEKSEYERMDFKNMHANFIKITSQKYNFKNKPHLARKKLQHGSESPNDPRDELLC
jgi:hypothetical protein